MIINIGDIVEVDRHGTAKVINVDFDNDRSLVDFGTRIFWTHNRNLTRIRGFYEVTNITDLMLMCADTTKVH
jgi:hypothetical protein